MLDAFEASRNWGVRRRRPWGPIICLGRNVRVDLSFHVGARVTSLHENRSFLDWLAACATATERTDVADFVEAVKGFESECRDSWMAVRPRRIWRRSAFEELNLLNAEAEAEEEEEERRQRSVHEPQGCVVVRLGRELWAGLRFRVDVGLMDLAV